MSREGGRPRLFASAREKTLYERACKRSVQFGAHERRKERRGRRSSHRSQQRRRLPRDFAVADNADDRADRPRDRPRDLGDAESIFSSRSNGGDQRLHYAPCLLADNPAADGMPSSSTTHLSLSSSGLRIFLRGLL